MQRKTHKHRLLPATLSLAMVLTMMVPAHAAAAGQQPPVPETTVNSDLFSHAFKLDFGYQSASWLEHITGLWVDGMPYDKVSSTIYLKTGTYVVQPSDGRIVLPPGLTGAVKCVVRADGYEDLDLTVDTGRYTVAVAPPTTTGTLPATGTTANVSASLEQVMSVYLKLTITGADGYVGGITGIRRTSADGSGADLAAVTYKPNLSGPAYHLDASESAVYFDAMDPALRDGDTLRITNGQYKDLMLKITRTDGGYQAQVVSEEPTQPQPKPVSEKLADRLTLTNSVQEATGSYRLEQASQAIREFGGANETVTVPAQIRTWLGAAAGSPRGSLGYALAESGEPVQTRLIPAGCDLTLTGLDLLSSVKVVVQTGGKLTLRDSVVQGVVEVEQGGTFSMNYDSTSSKFLTGAAINGQLRLKSGAVLENAAVCSDSSRDAKNTQPVVAVLGNATVKGYVLDTLTVTDQNNKAVKLTQKSDLKYTFEMPASQVSVQATFVKESAARKPDQPVTHVVPSTPLVPATPVTPTTPVTPAAVPFKDVSATDYFYATVQWAVGKNVTQGTSANTFSPDARCNRAQVVTFLWRAAGSPAPKDRTLPFRDVRPGDYCYDAVCWAVEKDITGGTGNGAFSPDKDCTRGQIVSLLYRGVQQNAFSW